MMKHIYKIALRASYLLADLAEYILDPITNAVWDKSGALEYWAHERLTTVKEREDGERRWREKMESVMNDAEIFGFIRAAVAYLDEMAARGDHTAMHLHVVAVGILAEHGEEIDQ